MRYVRSQADLLTRALSQCLRRLRSPHPLPVMKRLLVGASILESLRTSTLLSGSRRGYGNELVWRLGGLGLKESIVATNKLSGMDPGNF
jgi:hypothetical protein